MNAHDLLLFAEAVKVDWDGIPEHFVAPGYAAASRRLLARGLLEVNPTNPRYIRVSEKGRKMADLMIKMLAETETHDG